MSGNDAAGDAHYTDEELDDALDTGDPRIAQHLTTCAHCSATSVQLAQTRELLRDFGRDLPELPTDWDALVAGALTRARVDPDQAQPVGAGHRHGPASRRVRRPWLVAAAASAALLLGGGLTMNALSGSSSESSNPIAASATPSVATKDERASDAAGGGAPAAAGSASAPVVLASGRDYQTATLEAQVRSLLSDAARSSATASSGIAVEPSGEPTAEAAAPSARAPLTAGTQDLRDTQSAPGILVPTCLDAARQAGATGAIVAVDTARWQGRAATLVVLTTPTTALDVYAFPAQCAGPGQRVGTLADASRP